MSTLRARFREERIVVAPGVHDGLSALMVERAGFEAAYVSGAAICYTRFGFPDIGLVSLPEVVGTVAAIRERSALPLIVDIDTGFGNAMNVRRTIGEFERAGASAVQLEDQATPKRCGHLRDKTVIPAAEMVGKIKAALDARTRDVALIARTDAIAVEGFAPALERAERYAEAGADMIFVEAPPSREALAEVARRFAGKAPVMANMVEGGKTPILPAAELEALGFRLAIFPGGTVRALAHTLDAYLASLKAHGTTDPWRGRMFDFAGLNDLLGTEALLARGRRYDAETR